MNEQKINEQIYKQAKKTFIQPKKQMKKRTYTILCKMSGFTD